MTEAPITDLPRPEPEGEFRVPSQYPRCRRAHCHQQPVADMCRTVYSRWSGRGPAWYAYCADHLRGYGREVRDGLVWWVGIQEGER